MNRAARSRTMALEGELLPAVCGMDTLIQQSGLAVDQHDRIII
jgi:hypothetical protein